jgi:hypothetical protein
MYSQADSHEPSVDEMMQHMDQIAAHYGRTLSFLSLFSKRLDACQPQNIASSSPSSPMLLSSSATISVYSSKVAALKQAMAALEQRMQTLQGRLNSVRLRLPKNHVFIELGTFVYRCVYPGGVRYRNFPSFKGAVVTDVAMVAYQQEVPIVEKMFITAGYISCVSLALRALSLYI